MTTFAFDPKKHIDRTADKEIFTKLLQLEDSARILAIRDSGGMGKSSLLRWFEYHCRWGGDDVPSTLTVLGELTDHTSFGLISKIREQFRDDPTLDFSRFDELDYARANQRAAPFGPRSSSRGTATADSVTGGIVAGTVDTAIAGGVGTYNAAQPVWTNDLENRARTDCVNAFLEDLHVITAERPFAIMLDAFEKCLDPLRSWVFESLLRRHVLTANRCHGLVVVIAGRELPEVDALPDEIKDRFVRSIGSLKDWTTEHLRDFLRVYGFDDPSDNEVNFIQEQVGAGRMSLLAALQLVQSLRFTAA